MTSYYIKDPDAVLDYASDWSGWLASGEAIVNHEILISPDTSDGLNIDDSSITASSVTVWLSGGLDQTKYRVTYRVTTDQGRTDDRTVTVRVQQR